MGTQIAGGSQIASAPPAVLQGTPPNTSFDRQLQDAMVRPPISASSANAATIDPPANKPAPTSGPSRVVIHAIADSWLQVGDGRSPAIFMQVLRAGETYSVPDRPGLRFDTGNAGGLEITVDGKPVPPVGPSGAVRRNISLDAEKLLAGTIGSR
jgi:cytoskeleton protein RodZ